MRKRIVAIVVMTLMLFSLSGCVVDIDGKHNGLSIGFSFRGPRYSQIMYAVKSDNTEFDINDVTVDLFIGWFSSDPLFPIAADETGYCVGVVFYITTSTVGQWIDPQDDYHNVENQFFVKEIPASEFTIDNFRASQTRSKGKVFSHSGDSITIPKAAFKRQEGTIELYAQVISYSYEDELFHFDSSWSGSWYTVYIHYNRIDDNTVKLYRK